MDFSVNVAALICSVGAIMVAAVWKVEREFGSHARKAMLLMKLAICGIAFVALGFYIGINAAFYSMMLEGSIRPELVIKIARPILPHPGYVVLVAIIFGGMMWASELARYLAKEQTKDAGKSQPQSDEG